MRALIARAIQEEYAEQEPSDDGHEWPAAEEIGHSPAALSVAEELAASAHARERAVAAHVLATFVNGNDNKSQIEDAISLLARMIGQMDDLHLEWSIALALSVSWDASALEPLLRLCGSSSARVREAVARGLGGALVYECLPQGIEALIRLTGDPAPQVRDWATFALGQLSADTPAIRAALWERVDDPDYDTRCEALVGLASRGETALTGRVIAELGRESVGRLVVEAAMQLAQPALLEPLLMLKTWWDVDPELLEQAINACQPYNALPSP